MLSKASNSTPPCGVIPAVVVAVNFGSCPAGSPPVVNVWSASMNCVPSPNCTTPRMWYRVLAFIPATNRLTIPPVDPLGCVQVVSP